MRLIRAFVIDDSAQIRRLLTQSLAAVSGVQVVGMAATENAAAARIELLHPDVLLVNLDSREVPGLQLLSRIAQRFPQLPVLTVSARLERSAELAFDSMERGAADHMTLPRPHSRDEEEAKQSFTLDLVRRLRAIAHSQVDYATSIRPTRTPQSLRQAQSVRSRRFRTPGALLKPAVIVIGSSTGGPQALSVVFSKLPSHVQVPIVIAQHMPPGFTRLLAERLSAQSGRSVTEARDRELLIPSHVWIAPGDRHLTIEQSSSGPCLRLNQDPPEHSCRPAVDPLFRSAARIFGERTLGVVLTGMGKDGSEGSREIIEAGGSIIAQDEASSVVWGMPGFVVKAGLADTVLPLDEISTELGMRMYRQVRLAREVGP